MQVCSGNLYRKINNFLNIELLQNIIPRPVAYQNHLTSNNMFQMSNPWVDDEKMFGSLQNVLHFSQKPFADVSDIKVI